MFRQLHSCIIIADNVMVDARALTGPTGVMLEDDRHLDRFWNGPRRGGLVAVSF